MEPRKLDLLICTYSYGGNGGIASQSPYLTDWLLRTIPLIQSDKQIGRIDKVDLCDTPITMTRNRSVLLAREGRYDVLLMLDSDMWPDFHCGDPRFPQARPFWQTSFDFLYGHFDRGPVAVAAPYGGPPPHENVYVFHWTNQQSDHPDDIDMQLVQYSRHEAAELAGIQEAAALPTGVILWDMRLFELTEPREKSDRPWFFYEYTNLYESEKGSTEDVTATREISLAGCAKLGYNPIFCNWDAWAGHVKQKVVGRPALLRPDMINQSYRRMLEEGRLESNQQQSVVRSDIAQEIDWSKAERVSFAGKGDGNGQYRQDEPKPEAVHTDDHEQREPV